MRQQSDVATATDSIPATTQTGVVPFADVKRRIVIVRDQAVILDADVADLYGVATRQVNEAARNNPDKFPTDYRFELSESELLDLRSKFSTANVSSKSRVLPKAFTEKGLYMLATILKSKRATAATCPLSAKLFPSRAAGAAPR